MARIPDINVQAWMDLLQSLYNASGPCYGGAAILALVGQQHVDARRMVDSIPDDVYLKLSIVGIREDLDMVGSRLHSYVTALQAMPETPTLDDRIQCERIYYWLTTGKPPDWKEGEPDLRMGDARLVATLWNQAAQAAVVNHEQNEAIPLPFGSTPEGTYAKEKLRAWMSNTAHAFEESAPGEEPTLRDKIVAGLEKAADAVDDYVQKQVDDIITALKWTAAGLGVVLLLYLLLRK